MSAVVDFIEDVVGGVVEAVGDVVESVVDDGTVQLLTWVKIKNTKTNKEVEYKIVPENESSLKENKISSESPIGKALLSKKAFDKVKVKVPAGDLEFEILNIRDSQYEILMDTKKAIEDAQDVRKQSNTLDKKFKIKNLKYKPHEKDSIASFGKILSFFYCCI
jgi:hypothetical protein